MMRDPLCICAAPRCICVGYQGPSLVDVANRTLSEDDSITGLDYADDGVRPDPLRFKRAASPLVARLYAKLVHQGTIHQVHKHQEWATNTTLTRSQRRKMVLQARRGVV